MYSALHIDNLALLFDHKKTLESILPDRSLFLVGGVVRDLLLSTNLKPKDIDITGPGEPDTYRDASEKWGEENSRFRTEKYGTMSFIPRTEELDETKNTTETITTPLTYELTPFRTEGDYSDCRHPDELERSDDLILDSGRRDFGINCLYRYGYTRQLSTKTVATLTNAHSIYQTSDIHSNRLQELLSKSESYICRGNNTGHATVYISDHALIKSVFPGGNCNVEKLDTLIKSTPILISLAGKPKLLSSKNRLYNEIQTELYTNISQRSIVIDPHHGFQDLVQGKIRTVGNPDDRFKEDALRVIRALRFVNTLNQKIPHTNKQNAGFDIDKKTRESILTHAHLVKQIARERYHIELIKVCLCSNLFGFVCLVRETGLMPYIFPDLIPTIGNDQPIRYHPFDTYNHTLLTLHALQNQLTNHSPTNHIPGGSDLHQRALVYLAMLYHDIGKPEQYASYQAELDKNPENPDRSAYIHHTESGAVIAQSAFSKLCFSKKQIQQISRYIRMHHRPGEILDANPKNRLKKIRTLFSEGGLLGSLWLIDIAISDRLGQFNPLQAPAITELQQMQQTIIELHKQEGRFTRDQLAINGRDILEVYTDINPGPIIGELLDKAFDRVLTDLGKRNTKEQLHIYISSLIKDPNHSLS